MHIYARGWRWISSAALLGSVTKQFTAAAILVLQEQGKLKVADLLSDYVDDSPEAWENVTLHHLRNHSSGIPNYTDFIDSTEARTPLGTSGTVALFKDKPLDFAPGARFSYSNSGYHMLGCVIEKASGKPYDEFLKKVVFDPLRMADSGYDSTSALIARRASGYSLAAGDWKNAAYLDMGIPLRCWRAVLDNRRLTAMVSRVGRSEFTVT
jgi:CubicO group peptidase (beta-lactamase class C family)